MSIRVLIADHQSARREYLRAALASDPAIEIAGQAQDGQDALQKAFAMRPNIVLAADDLSGGDGFHTAERLAASRLPLETIVIAGGDPSGSLRRAMRAGARECLEWPPGPPRFAKPSGRSGKISRGD